MVIHNPNNAVYSNFYIPIKQEDSTLADLYPGAAQPLVLSNIINFALLGMTIRVFAYECIAIFHSGNIMREYHIQQQHHHHHQNHTQQHVCFVSSPLLSSSEWASSVWNWIDIFSVIFYVLAVVCPDFGWTSRMVAALTLVQFWKTLFFLKALRPIATLVQVNSSSSSSGSGSSNSLGKPQPA